MKKIDMNKVKNLKNIEKELNSFIFEREEVIKLLIISLIGEFNLFLIGDTGQAKTYAAQQLAKRITGMNSFYILMNKQIDVSSIFGKLDIPALVKGEQKVLTKNMATESHLNIWDEIWKTDDIAANTLLNAWNEREVVLEGNTYKMPTIANICASNEIPDLKGEDAILKPLYDRLDFIIETAYIQEEDNFLKLLESKRNKKDKIVNTISLDEVKEIIEMVDEVECPVDILKNVWKIKNECYQALSRRISDRKLGQVEKVLKTHALYNLRDKVIDEDLMILKYYFIYYPVELETVEKIIEKYAINPLQNTLITYKSMVKEIFENAEDIKDIEDVTAKEKEISNLYQEVIKMYEMYEELEQGKVSEKDKDSIKKGKKELDEKFKKFCEENDRTYIKIAELKSILNRKFI